jgi:hypothetical protein
MRSRAMFLWSLSLMLSAAPRLEARDMVGATDNASRRRQCEINGGQAATVDEKSFTCTLVGDAGVASVTCVEGGACACSAAKAGACEEWGGSGALDRRAPAALRARGNRRMSALRAEIASYNAEIVVVRRQAVRVGNMTPVEYKSFDARVTALYRRANAISGQVSGVDCAYQCQTEYDKCLQRASGPLCKLDALVCVARCVRDRLPHGSGGLVLQ